MKPTCFKHPDSKAVIFLASPHILKELWRCQLTSWWNPLPAFSADLRCGGQPGWESLRHSPQRGYCRGRPHTWPLSAPGRTAKHKHHCHPEELLWAKHCRSCFLQLYQHVTVHLNKTGQTWKKAATAIIKQNHTPGWIKQTKILFKVAF